MASAWEDSGVASPRTGDMRWHMIWICGCLAGCGADKAAVVLRHPMAEMHGLDANARWIWRTDSTGSVDSGRVNALDEDGLIWASHAGSGVLELRQGATWETGAWWGPVPAWSETSPAM